MQFPSFVFRSALALASGVLSWSLLASPAQAELAQPVGTANVHELLWRPDLLRQRVLQASHELGAARARVNQADAETRASRLLLNPVVDATLSQFAINGTPVMRDSVWNAGVSETVELGKRGPRRAAAELHASATRKDFEMSLLDRLSDTRQAMAEALFQRLRSLTLEEAWEDAKRGTELERVRYEQKALSGVDYDRLLLDLATQRAELEKTRAEAAAAISNCSALLLSNCDLSGGDERDLETALQIPNALDTQLTLSRRPDLQSLALESDSARKSAELARHRAIPDVTVRLGYQRDNSMLSTDARDSLSLGISLPIALSDYGQHEAARALARASELDETRQAATISSQSTVIGLSVRRRALAETLTMMERESLPLAKSVLDSSQQGFDHGGLSLTDLLLARRSYVALRLAVLEQRFELFNVQNELLHELGLDPPAPPNQP